MADVTNPTEVVVEYENTDITPVFVEGAQGMKTPNGALQVSFYSEHMKPLETLATVSVPIEDPDRQGDLKFKTKDPFGLDTGSITIVRRIEASLFLTEPSLKILINWLNLKLLELQRK